MLSSQSRDLEKLAAPSPPPGSACARPLWRRWLVLGLLLAAGAAALLIDDPVARWMAAGGIRGDVADVLGWSEFFGLGVGVLLVILAVHQLDPFHRPTVPRLLAASLGAGLAADVIKLVVARFRPRDFDLSYGALESFSGWFPLGAGGSAVQSFPSAHTATAVGLALALAWLYPRGRWLFVVLALLVAGQRLQSCAHFLSDTFIGAGVGWLFAVAVLPGGVWAGWFDRWEARRLRAACGFAPPRHGYSIHAKPQAARLVAAQQCGTWLFRRRTYTLVPLAAFIVGAALVVSEASPVWSYPGFPLRLAGIGALLAAGAIRLDVAGRARRGTSARGVTFEAGTLITTGMYALLRNPLYAANVLIWCGMAMLCGSLAVVAVVAAVVAVHYHLIVLAEERYLARRYRGRYAEYCRSVRRWIPRVAPKADPKRRREEPGPLPAPFTWSRVLFREADTLFLLVLGAWFISGLSQAWTPWHRGVQVPGAWYFVPVGPALAWLGIKWLKKSRWSRRREPAVRRETYTARG